MSAVTVRAERIQTVLGPAWQATCTCGWEGRTHGLRGARDAAREERWEHELDHEDGLA